MAQRSDRALSKKVTQLDPLRVVIDHEGFGDCYLMFVARGNQLVDILGFQRNRLFAENMFARFCSLQRPFDMLRGWQRDIDTIHFITC